MKDGPHLLLFSESGTGKSTFAATMIASPPQMKDDRPVLVQLFDAADKGTPYRMRGDAVTVDASGPVPRELVTKGGKLVAVIERWHEREGRGSGGVTMKGGEKVKTGRYTRQGENYEKYLERMRDFVAECEDGAWWGVILDSTTFLEHAMRSYLTGVMKVADNMMIWNQATDELERFLLATFPDLPITTIVIAHAVPEKDIDYVDGKKKRVRGVAGDVPYEARLPGRLAADIFATFGEIYRCYYDKKSNDFYVQTRRDGVWRCASQLGVSNPLGPQPNFRDVYKQAVKVRGGKSDAND